ncbi:hypothetical protein [Nostoc sp. UHCC 0251]|uniref:hypothetical protein n=1 Tax=Nostoc sp. UHCC 0251 TaxID=3110240 RepID=UPI002B1F93B4|nr:hypothetical protein [Nostoc sp. UHCC 0251]MEA5628418.1 hypothetical protein [Nostoc sp. UHCC 0251]
MGKENFWIYGAIEPLTGQHFQQEYPKLNGDYFQQFLDWLSEQLGEDYAILQIDQAPAHISGAINWPENIIPLQQSHLISLNSIQLKGFGSFSKNLSKMNFFIEERQRAEGRRLSWNTVFCQ